jgi:glutathione S-transferase
MLVVPGTANPWVEAAKGIFHIKGIEWAAVPIVYDSEALKAWAGQRNGPVVVYNNERPRPGWAEILLLAERLAPTPPLLPHDAQQRALMLGMAHEICGEAGLGWSRRNQLVHAGLHNAGGFSIETSKYLGKKYGYNPQAGADASERVAALLAMLVARLKAQQEAGSPYYVGDAVSALDIYSATFAGMFSPLPHAVCPIEPSTRAAFELSDARIDAVCDPILFAHRDMMYARHLALPLSF